MTFEPITQPRRWLLTPLRVPKRNTRPSHFTKGTAINCPSYLKPCEMQKHTTVKPKHCIKCIWFWLTVDYCSEKCAMRQLSTLFKMHSIDMVDYEGHLPILHASLLIWAGNWKRQRRTRKQKKKRNSRNISSLSFSEYKPHIDIIQQSMNQTSTVFLLKPADHWPWNRTKMYNSQERSVMPTGQKKIYWTLTITFFSP